MIRIAITGSKMTSFFKCSKWFFMMILAMTLKAAASAQSGERLVVSNSGNSGVGLWRIDFHPNQAVRTYEIYDDGTVTFVETGWIGNLIPVNLPNIRGRWTVRFKDENEGITEIITQIADGRLLVEHFNPAQTPLPRVDQIGIGERLDVNRPGQKSSPDAPTDLNSDISRRVNAVADLPQRAIDRYGDARLRHAAPVTSVAVSPDGRWIASGSLMGEQRIWNAETGALLHTLEEAYGNYVSLMAFSPDGQSLAAFKGRLICWDPATGQKKFHFEDYGFPLDLAFSPDGKTLAVAAMNTEDVVLYNTQTGQIRSKYSGHAKYATSVAYSPDGRWLASLDQAGTLFLRDLGTEKTTQYSGLHGKLSFSPDSNRLAINTGPTVTLYKLDDAGLVTPAERKLDHGLYVKTYLRTARFSADGERLSWGERVWDLATGKPCVEHNGMMNGPAEWFPNGDRLVSAGADGIVRVINAHSGETLLPAPEPKRVFNQLLSLQSRLDMPHNWPQLGHLQVALVGSHSGILAFVRSADQRITMVNTRSSREGEFERTVWPIGNIAKRIPFSGFQLGRNGSQIVTMVDNRLEVWSVTAGEGPRFVLNELTTYDMLQPEKPYQSMTQFEISPDGLEVAALIAENVIVRHEPDPDRKEAAQRQIFKVWSLGSGEETLSLTGPVRRVNDPTMGKFSFAHDSIWHNRPDGTRPKFLATGTTTLDDPDSEPNRRHFKLIPGTDGSGDFGTIKFFSPDDKWMLTERIGGDKFATERAVRDLTQPGCPILWHPEGDQFAVSPDGQWLACCESGWDKQQKKLMRVSGDPSTSEKLQKMIGGPDQSSTIVIRVASTGKQLISFSGHLGPIHSAYFSPDGRCLATASGDGTTLFWDLTTFEGKAPEPMTTDDAKQQVCDRFLAEDDPDPLRTFWRYVLDADLNADLQRRLADLLTSKSDPGLIVRRAIAVAEYRGLPDSVQQLKALADNPWISREHQSLARQSLARLAHRSESVPEGEAIQAPSVKFHAYWMVRPDQEGGTGYRKLLITRGPVAQMAQRTLNWPRPTPADHEPAPVLDREAFTFDTYGDDCLWGRAFGTVDSFGTFNVARRQLTMNEKAYDISDCPIDVVLRLLANPLGTAHLHRPNHPLSGAKETARAFEWLLKEQQTLQ